MVGRSSTCNLIAKLNVAGDGTQLDLNHQNWHNLSPVVNTGPRFRWKIMLLIVMPTPMKSDMYLRLHPVAPYSCLLPSDSSLLLLTSVLLLTLTLKAEVVCVDDRVCVVDGKWTNERKTSVSSSTLKMQKYWTGDGCSLSAICLILAVLFRTCQSTSSSSFSFSLKLMNVHFLDLVISFKAARSIQTQLRTKTS